VISGTPGGRLCERFRSAVLSGGRVVDRAPTYGG
jgi:hypothetical protein